MGTSIMKLVLVALIIASVLVTADELKDLSSADTPAPAVEKKAETKVEKAGGAQLGESEGFGGALMTSGSFTMMAASAGFEEEGELGEGEGFGGALMTSGSFTMMAASAGFEE